MIRKCAYAMELARDALAQEIGQDPDPELAAVRQEGKENETYKSKT
jgi:hypothetical protein